MGKKTKAFRGPNDGNKNTDYVHSMMKEATSLKFPHTVSEGKRKYPMGAVSTKKNLKTS